MNSMTGYGKGLNEINGRKVTIEMKSVNHRFLDINIKMPRIFNCLEEKIRNYIKEHIFRGHIDIYINYDAGTVEAPEVELNEKAASRYLEIANHISDKFNIENDIKVSDLFSLKEIIIDKEVVADEKILTELTIKALDEAIKNLMTMRATEGDKISKNLYEKLNNITIATDKIKEIAPMQIENYRNKLKERITEALGEITLDESKLLNELVFYADKVATDEEFTRLHAHIDHFKEIIIKPEPIGRQLDFIVQEMHREANTIGSKCNDLQVGNYVLSLKTDIEKIREQIQNIE